MARSWTTRNLREELVGYEKDLRAVRSLKRSTIQQYCDHVETMISWMEGLDRSKRSMARPPRRRRSYATPSGIEVASVARLGVFAKSGAGEIVSFTRGWRADVHADQGAFEVQLGITTATVYGRDRAQAVVWVDGARRVTGSETDRPGFEGCYASLIRPSKLALGPADALPRGYHPATIVLFADMIESRLAHRHQAVVLDEQDHPGWAHHALVHVLTRPDR